MHRTSGHRRAAGFTKWDLLIVIAAVLIFSLAGLMWLGRPAKKMSSRIGCVNKLKQVGLGMRIYANDNNDKFPWQASTTDSGSREFIGLGQTFRHFQAASDQIGSPKILFCEKDPGRTPAMDWGPSFGTNNLSYFVGLDAMQTNAQLILSGDRHLTFNGKSLSGVVSLSTNSMVGWTRFIHGGFGNVALLDGGVQQVSPHALRLQVERADRANFRFEIP
jgi:hypothetical protein